MALFRPFLDTASGGASCQTTISPKKPENPERPRRRSPPPDFDTQAFLSSVEVGQSNVKYRAKETVFRQGDAADAVFYIEKGGVQLSVVSHQGKEAVVAMLWRPGDFFGEGCLAGQDLHMASAVARLATSAVQDREERDDPHAA